MKLSKYNFKIGDNVKVIPGDYSNMLKSVLGYPNAWQQSIGRSDPRVMLGGEYSILQINKNSVIVTDNNTNNIGIVGVDDLVPVTKVNYCKFNVGDEVKFHPITGSSNIEFMNYMENYNFNNSENSYRITAILNNYYIFLNYDPKHRLSFPFRWEDFKKSTANQKGQYKGPKPI